MILSTTDSLDGRPVAEYLGVISAEVVFGTNAVRDFFAGIRDVIGGRTSSYEKVFSKGHKEVLKELEERAEKLGADAVVGIEIDTGSINVEEKGSLILVTAAGTAVKLK